MKNYKLSKREITNTKGLTLAQLIQSTEQQRKYRGINDIVIKALKKVKTKGGKPVIYGVMSSGTDPTKTYDAWITIMEEGQDRIPPDCLVQVQCTCDDYLYMWEYANAAQSAARIFYGNGEPPDDKNPKYRPGLCKHAYLLAHKLLPSA
jgi:hypothetical protein